MCVSDVLLRRPNCPASIPGPSRLSRVAGATFSEEELRALILEYETQAPLFSPDEYLAMMPAEGETQAPPPPKAPAPLLPVVGPCADDQEHSKKRKASPSQPSTEGRLEGPRRSKRKPPSQTSTEGRLEGPRRSKRAKRKPPSQKTQNKMVATRILNRWFRAPETSRRRTVLWCQCQELPRESPGCALHQAAPDRSWMTEQGHIPTVGAVGEVLVPKLSAHDRREVVNQYRRWRSRVWMPSRFYVECAQEKRALQDDCIMLA